MDFNDTPEEAKFREEARAWLETNVPSEKELEGLDDMARAKLWQKRKADAGWACITWPKEYGGRGATSIEQVILNQEESKVKAPGTGQFQIGQGMAAPTMMMWASDEQKGQYLPKLASGEDIWCQLFSEPAGGSDLAALRTKAERDGDEWVVNGQKIWTSGAHYSDYGILVLRTDPDVPKHQGLTYFFLDMKSPGIDIKPIRQISGDSNFNEVYFSDVRIPDAQRLGAVGQGWQVALTTLMNERAAIGGGGGGAGFDQLLSLAKQVKIGDKPAIEDSEVRSKLANFYVRQSGLRFTGLRSMTALSRGETPGPENSIGKLGLRIAGGTDEIMANIIAERVLGLPQEPRVDKGIPFTDVPTSN
jgi:alkylation response protein AidB-like acyl-CoA dehydrogenase